MRTKARERAIGRGMGFIVALVETDGCLDYLGSGLLYFCRSLATTSPDRHLRTQARQIGRVAFAHWQSTMWGDTADPDAAWWVAELVRGYAAGEDLGVRSPSMKRWLASAVARFDVDDFLLFDPRREAPPAGCTDECDCGTRSPRGRGVCVNRACRAPLTRMSRYRLWCNAFTGAYCAERYGVPFRARYRDVVRWLPQMRPYRIDGRSSTATFYDIAYTITHLVYTLNDYGLYRLEPAWLPWEYEFLRTYIDTAIACDDPDLVGEFLDALRAFGQPEDDAAVARGYDYVLGAQNADGSWGAWDADTLYTGFHATWAAIDGLREFAWQGPALFWPDLKPSLERWARIDYAPSANVPTEKTRRRR